MESKWLKIKLTLSEEEPRSAGSRVLIALGVQCLRNRGRAAEKHANVRVGMFLSQRREHTVPVGPTEMSGGPEGGDCVLLSTDILNLVEESEELKNWGFRDHVR